MTRRVFVISNDVTPGLGLPAAAPGLRAFGLAEGLRAHGYEVETLVPAALLEQLWSNPASPPPLQPGTVALGADKLAAYLAARQPATVVMTNSNKVRDLDAPPGSATSSTSSPRRCSSWPISSARCTPTTSCRS